MDEPISLSVCCEDKDDTMTQKYKHQHDQLIEQRETFCEITMDADRIKLELSKIYPKAFARVAGEMENMQLCRYTVIEGKTLWLMQPDYGMFSDDDELRTIVKELFNEENYNIIYKE